MKTCKEENIINELLQSLTALHRNKRLTNSYINIWQDAISVIESVVIFDLT